MKCSRVIALTFGVVAMVSVGISSAADWATSEGSCYAKGDKLLSIGAAVYPFGAYGAFDYGIHDCISAGGAVGFIFDPFWNSGFIPIVARGAFHPFNLTVLADKIRVRDKLDVYLGPSVYFRIGLGHPGHFWVQEYIGVRYKLNDKIMLFAEDCAGMGYINIGVTFKL